MWEEIDVVAMPRSERRSTPHALRDLGLLVAAAILAVILPLIT